MAAVSVGAKITARINSKLRGGEVIELHSDGSITAEFYTPSRIVQRLEEDQFVLSEDYATGQGTDLKKAETKIDIDGDA